MLIIMTRTTKQEQDAIQNAEQAYSNDPVFEPDPAPLPTTEMSLVVAAPEHKESVRVVDQNRVLHIEPPSITRIKLVQRTSMVGTAGCFRDQSTGEEFTELYPIPIGIKARRALLNQEYREGEKPRCVSNDGQRAITQYADGNLLAYPGMLCKDCPKFSANLWALNHERCEPQWIIYGYLPDTGQVISLRLRRVTYHFAHFWNSNDRFRRNKIKMWPVEETGGKGRYYTIAGQDESRLTAQQQEQIEAFAAACDFSAGLNIEE
jgi:hypothetical protein